MANDFTSEFNRRLGNKTGSVAKAPTPLIFEQDPVARQERIQRATLFSKIAKMNEQNQAPSQSSSPVGQTFEPVLGNLTQNDVNIITDTAEQGGVDNGGNFFKDLGSGLLEGAGRGIDVISRPYYGLMESMKEASESMNEGQNVLESVDDVVGGAWSGLSGKEKTGFGEVVEENANRDPGSGNILNYLSAPTSLIGEGLNNEARS